MFVVKYYKSWRNDFLDRRSPKTNPGFITMNRIQNFKVVGGKDAMSLPRPRLISKSPPEREWSVFYAIEKELLAVSRDEKAPSWKRFREFSTLRSVVELWEKGTPRNFSPQAYTNSRKVAHVLKTRRPYIEIFNNDLENRNSVTLFSNY